jgi:hypothetical protein
METQQIYMFAGHGPGFSYLNPFFDSDTKLIAKTDPAPLMWLFGCQSLGFSFSHSLPGTNFFPQNPNLIKLMTHKVKFLAGYTQNTTSRIADAVQTDLITNRLKQGESLPIGHATGITNDLIEKLEFDENTRKIAAHGHSAVTYIN